MAFAFPPVPYLHNSFSPSTATCQQNFLPGFWKNDITLQASMSDCKLRSWNRRDFIFDIFDTNRISFGNIQSRHFMSEQNKRRNDDEIDTNIDKDNELDGEDDLLDDDAILELLALEDIDDDINDEFDEPDFDELKELEQFLEQQGWKIGLDEEDENKNSSWIIEESRRGRFDDVDKRIENVQKQERERQQQPKEILSPSALEKALMQGVVPASAGVGSKCLPADYGFDPLGLATKDYFKKAQDVLVSLLPERKDESDSGDTLGGAALPLSTKPIFTASEKRPAALILRDYREIEIRHGRLAMLAAILWPLQEIIDRLFIPDLFGSTTLVYGGVTLPYVSLFMTLVMLLLGYLDIYATTIKELDTGDAFLPGECFWDPLSILDGATDETKRNMQARELNNGRMAMIAVLSYILQEVICHQPLISLPWNQFLFEPAFEIPAVQAWLDEQFAGASKGVDKGVVQEFWREVLDESTNE